MSFDHLSLDGINWFLEGGPQDGFVLTLNGAGSLLGWSTDKGPFDPQCTALAPTGIVHESTVYTGTADAVEVHYKDCAMPSRYLRGSGNVWQYHPAAMLSS